MVVEEVELMEAERIRLYACSAKPQVARQAQDRAGEHCCEPASLPSRSFTLPQPLANRTFLTFSSTTCPAQTIVAPERSLRRPCLLRA